MFTPGDEVDAQHPEDPSGGFAAATIHAVAADGCYAVKVRRSRPPRRAWKPRVDPRVVAHPAPDPTPPPPQFEMRDGGWTDPLTVSEQAIRARVKEGEFSLDQMQQEGGATAQSGGSETATMFKVGDVVEARYGGGRFGRGGLACRRGAGVVRECGWEREEAVARSRERCWGVRLLGQLMRILHPSGPRWYPGVVEMATDASGLVGVLCVSGVWDGVRSEAWGGWGDVRGPRPADVF